MRPPTAILLSCLVSRSPCPCPRVPCPCPRDPFCVRALVPGLCPRIPLPLLVFVASRPVSRARARALAPRAVSVTTPRRTRVTRGRQSRAANSIVHRPTSAAPVPTEAEPQAPAADAGAVRDAIHIGHSRHSQGTYRTQTAQPEHIMDTDSTSRAHTGQITEQPARCASRLSQTSSQAVHLS